MSECKQKILPDWLKKLKSGLAISLPQGMTRLTSQKVQPKLWHVPPPLLLMASSNLLISLYKIVTKANKVLQWMAGRLSVCKYDPRFEFIPSVVLVLASHH